MRDGSFYIRQLNIFNERAANERLSPFVCRVYYYFLHVNNKARWAKTFGASTRQIADDTLMNKDTATACIRRLVEGGYIRYKPSKIRGQSSQIEIVDLCPNKSDSKSGYCLNESDTKKGVCLNESDTRGGFVSDANDEISDTKQLPTNNLFNTILSCANAQAEGRERFLEFWKAYPRKKDRAKAEAAFLKLKPNAALLKKMLSAIRIQSASEQWTRDNGRFIPYPATWLNGRRWEDETETVVTGKHYVDF